MKEFPEKRERKSALGRKDSFKIRKADPNDANAIYAIMQRVSSKLPDKSLFVCDDLEFVQAHLQSNGFGVVACDGDNKIVASFLFRYPHMEEDNLGRDIDLAEEQLDAVVHMESAVVLPEHRGHNLQEKMLRYAESMIDKSVYHYFMATVSPDNPASYLSLEHNGYSLVATKKKYGGLVRRIYLKEW